MAFFSRYDIWLTSAPETNDDEDWENYHREIRSRHLNGIASFVAGKLLDARDDAGGWVEHKKEHGWLSAHLLPAMVKLDDETLAGLAVEAELIAEYSEWVEACIQRAAEWGYDD